MHDYLFFSSGFVLFISLFVQCCCCCFVFVFLFFFLLFNAIVS